MEFFTKEEIADFAMVANTEYSPVNKDHKEIAERLKRGVWEKSKYWVEQVTQRLPKFEFGFKKAWIQRGWTEGNRVSKFKPYTWARIHRIGNDQKDIYFTIGVDADTESLVYKLDYDVSQNGRLTAEGKAICENLIKASPASWIQIDSDDIEKFNWEILITKTVEFIENYTDLYDNVIAAAWSENENRVSRLTWNSNGWVFPSGPNGKSQSEDSHEAKYGYGHEEWLFDTSKIIDGYHYGFLEPIRKQQDTFSGKTFNVWLYTIDGETKKRYWVGNINNVEVISNDEANRVNEIYSERGWLKEMENQIVTSGGNSNGFSNWKGVDLFNIRYRAKYLEVNDPYLEIAEGHPIYKQSRYAFVFLQDEFEIEKSGNLDFEFKNKGRFEVDDDSDLQTKAYEREAKSVEIKYLHRSISNKLIPVLQAIYGDSNVVWELNAGYGSNRIDIVVKDLDQSLIFYEIKTYNSVVTSIREAIGQLMEYSCWPNHNKAKELVIITQNHSEISRVKSYMENLRKLFSIPIYYQSFDLENCRLSDRI